MVHMETMVSLTLTLNKGKVRLDYSSFKSTCFIQHRKFHSFKFCLSWLINLPLFDPSYDHIFTGSVEGTVDI